MRMLLSFLLLILIAGGNAFFAKKRGRDPVGWFLIGLLLGVFGFIVLLLLPKRACKSDLEQDEDRILAGINDSEENFINKEWFYLNTEHSQVGPISFNSLRKAWTRGDINATSLVWCEGMKDWEAIEHMPTLQDAIAPVELLS